MVRSLGADQVIDYTHVDFTEGGPRFDLILQAAGTQSSSDCRRALTPEGTLVLISGDSDGHWIGPVGRIIRALLLSRLVSQTIAAFTMKPNGADLQTLKELIEAGQVTPVMDRSYSLPEVPDALRYLEAGHAQGKVTISL